MAKNKMKTTEDELLSEDGIFSRKFSTVYDNAEKCSYCGCAVMPGEEAIRIYSNGDIVHLGCWQEYAEENMESFGKSFVYTAESEDEYI